MSVTQDGALSMDDAVTYLTASLTDPMSPNSCHLRMRCAASRIADAFKPSTANSAIRQVLKAYPQLVRAGIKFLTRKQSVEAHARMVKHLCQCRCQPEGSFQLEQMVRQAELHMYPKSQEDVKIPQPHHANHHLMLVVQVIANCIATTLALTTTGKFSNEKGERGNQSWPASANDLLPYGCADSVEGLKLWASEPNGHSIYGLAAKLSQFYPPFARATFKPPSYDFAMKNAFKHLDSAMTDYASDLSNPIFEDIVRAIVVFLGVHLISSSTKQANIIAMTSYRQQAMPILARLWAIYAPLPSSNVMRLNVALLFDIAKLKVNPQTNTFRPDLQYEQSNESALLSGNFDLTDFYGDTCVLIVQSLQGGCSNVDCPSRGSSVYARLCSKCHVVRYCDTQCQTEAWKHKKFPHKAICSKLHALKKQLGFKDWSQIRQTNSEDRNYREAFTALCKAKSVDVKAVQELEYHLRGVRGCLDFLPEENSTQ
ncbi:hypothetical protein NMY22_g17956 [Coprinellus aureogranulatus]|nr:hypothetical protein NMY22_g17956 [Coprinellus aureogranulatus]